MRLRFTKMQGAGNDFVVLDATRAPIALDADAVRRLGDRRFGVGADQILVVEPSATPGVDFRYRIYNNSGDEVEQCGNGARCFVRYVHDKGLSPKSTLQVETMNSLIELRLQPDGRVAVDMGAPIFELARVPFDAAGLVPRDLHGWPLWPLDVDGQTVEAAVLSMGNPHAVLDVRQFGGGAGAAPPVAARGPPPAAPPAGGRATPTPPAGRAGRPGGGVAGHAAPVAALGPRIEAHPRFARRVNVGFLQVVSRSRIRLRVHERGAGETLACGTGACAAVVAGIRQGALDARVDVDTRGGRLTIEWPNDAGNEAHVVMTGPAETVFEGEIEL